jgi:hypothetical protein
MKTKIFVVALVFLFSMAKSQSYEGDIGDLYPVWFDLEIPSSDGAVKGTYFYKKYGEDIQIAGNKLGNALSMKESGKNGKVSGLIECSVNNDSIVGTWKKFGGRSSLSLKLKKVDSQLRKYAKAMNGKSLRLAVNEMIPYDRRKTTLSEVLECKDCKDETGNPQKGPLDLEVYYAKNDIFSTSYHWSFYGAYPTEGNTYHTFNLLTNTEIVIWDEIDEAKMKDFNKYLTSKINPVLWKTRQQYPDSEWAQVFDPWMHDNESGRIRDSVGEFFKVDDIRTDCHNHTITGGTNYYIDSASLHFLFYDYFDFPHVIQNMDAGGDVVIPFPEFKKYLKKESVLTNML